MAIQDFGKHCSYHSYTKDLNMCTLFNCNMCTENLEV